MCSESADRRRSLAIRLPNWVGDVCMCLPALDALIAAGTSPVCYGRPWCADLLAAHPARSLPLPRSAFAAGRVLRSAPSVEILLFPGSFSCALAARLGGRRPLGRAGDWRRYLLWRRLPMPPAQCPESERFWQLARDGAAHLGLDDAPFILPMPAPRLPLTVTAREMAADLTRTLSRPWTLLCPLAVGTVGGRDKRWSGFSETARRLHAQGILTVCCPGPGEETLAINLLPDSRHLRGLDLQTYAALAQMADGVLANDSGPAHLAAAAGARTLVVFGVSDPRRYAPRTAQVIGDAIAWPTVNAVAGRFLEILADDDQPQVSSSELDGAPS